MRAQDKKVHMTFRKYNNGMISYEIHGPLVQRPFGEKINKYGKTVPEIIKWIEELSKFNSNFELNQEFLEKEKVAFNSNLNKTNFYLDLNKKPLN